MVKVTFGGKGERLKWNLYFFGILLAVGLGSCAVCAHFVNRSLLEHNVLRDGLLELEEQVVPGDSSLVEKRRELWGKCNKWMRDRWLVGYFIEGNEKGSFCGRPTPGFWSAIEEQKEAILAGQPFDKSRIPKFQGMIVFEKLNCRLLVGEAFLPQDMPQQRKKDGP